MIARRAVLGTLGAVLVSPLASFAQTTTKVHRIGFLGPGSASGYVREIEAIRGVKAGPMLRTLLQHRLVKVTGRADVPGRPLQYGTTQQFLERFGLQSLQELPSIKEWKNLG